MIRWGQPTDEPHQSKRDLAESAGFDPGEDHGGQPVMAPGEWDALPSDHPRKKRMARWTHQRSVEGCANCGERCDACGDRMCAQWGPEPRACSTVCVECRCDCETCTHVREDMRADLLHRIQGETR